MDLLSEDNETGPLAALSLLLTGVTALFYPQAGLGCLWPAGQLVRVTQGQNRP